MFNRWRCFFHGHKFRPGNQSFTPNPSINYTLTCSVCGIDTHWHEPNRENELQNFWGHVHLSPEKNEHPRLGVYVRRWRLQSLIKRVESGEQLDETDAAFLFEAQDFIDKYMEKMI